MGFMNGLSNAINQSLMTRFMANVISSIAILTALIVVAVQALTHQALDPWFVGIAGIGIGQYASVLGINQGVTLQPLIAKIVSAKASNTTPDATTTTQTTTQTTMDV